MAALYSTKKSRVGRLQPSCGVWKYLNYSSFFIISVLKVSPLPSPLEGKLKPALKKKIKPPPWIS